MSDLTKRLLRDESGATAIEYGMIVALIAVAILATVGAIGGQIHATFSAIIDGLISG